MTIVYNVLFFGFNYIYIYFCYFLYLKFRAYLLHVLYLSYFLNQTSFRDFWLNIIFDFNAFDDVRFNPGLINFRRKAESARRGGNVGDIVEAAFLTQTLNASRLISIWNRARAVPFTLKPFRRNVRLD